MYNFPCSYFILLILIKIPTCLCTDDAQYKHCNKEFVCGDLRHIKYPFWGENRPNYCGKLAYKLNCVNNIPTIEIKSLNYRVIQVNYYVHTITLARMDYSDKLCPSRLVNTTIDFTSFNYTSGTRNLTVGYGCPLNMSHVEYNCTINNTKTNVTYDPSMLCKQYVVVPAFENVASDLDQNRTSLVDALGKGFELKWFVSDVESEQCKNCIGSGGTCGVNTSNNSFICYCYNGPSLSVCDKRPGSSKNDSLTIALAIVGAVIAGATIGWGIFVCRQRRRRRAIKEATPTKTESKAILNKLSNKGLGISDTSNFTSSIPPYPSPKTSGTSKEFGKSTYFGAQVFTYQELEVATDNFNDSRELGDGGFGTVYYGKLLDGREVAVKRLHENSFRRMEQFMNEVRILTGLDHENLVKLYGCTSKRSKELLLVYEYIPNGTVADHLHGKLANSSSSLFSWSVRFNIAIQTADALAYLHESGIIHRDVKTTNILLDKSFRVKVADFGLSRLFENVTHVSTAPQGTPGYVDPEYYQCYHLTDKSDVYSFGVVLIELISSLQAVDTNRHRLDINLSNMAITKIQNHKLDELVDKSIGFETNGLVRRSTALVAELAFRCLQQQKDMRPTMKEVAEILREIRNDDSDATKPVVLDILVDEDCLLKDDNTEPTSSDHGIKFF
ncbi:hypothetical protein QVD17_10150 [Tagetes erecta]|uniref:non-specific serine/threonine protein kinase n=1 Tax=Tagetes erecta TaxID=13708 RepID=A0AAD8L5Q4_TARER|nr:hypothetical protein QVD17_10150 [Tagetes erecta]